jgi:hypothetical protein
MLDGLDSENLILSDQTYLDLTKPKIRPLVIIDL